MSSPPPPQPGVSSGPLPQRRRILRDSVSVGVAVGAYGLPFGAVGVASGLTAAQTQATSVLMFTGASQFALVGVLGAGGGALAAIATALLLGFRNALYGLRLAPMLGVQGWNRGLAAHLTIDESTAMALGNEDPAGDPRAARLAFWATGLMVFVFWNASTAVGALGAAALGDPRSLGLDAAIPAGFLALLWPRLRPGGRWSARAIRVALGGAAVALVLTPVLRPGVPVLAAALVAVVTARQAAPRR